MNARRDFLKLAGGLVVATVGAGMMVGEVRRRKALAKVLEYAEVTDTDGKAVDLTAFVTPGGQEALDAEAEATEADDAEAAEQA